MRDCWELCAATSTPKARRECKLLSFGSLAFLLRLSIAMSDDSRRYSADDRPRLYRFRDHGAGGDNRTATNLRASQNNSVGAKPDIIFDHDFILAAALEPNRRVGASPVIVIDKTSASSNQAIGPNRDSPAYVELATRTDECTIAHYNRRARFPNTIELKLNPSLQAAAISNLDLMRPTHVQLRQTGSLPDAHSLHRPIYAPRGTKNQRPDPFTDTKENLLCDPTCRHKLPVENCLDAFDLTRPAPKAIEATQDVHKQPCGRGSNVKQQHGSHRSQIHFP